ncbi:MAG: recombination-associated protein RdgC [Betaproteobacteria bacterium]|nr:recombination-associated protein RdgC [Betaproteobacteria bacterium]
MWFKNLLVYRIKPDARLKAEDIEDKLRENALQPCGSFEMESRGWVPPRGDERFLHSLERQWLITYGANQKILPGSVITQTAKERAAKLAEKQEHPVGRKQMREIRERVIEELMPKAFSRRRTLAAWIDPVNGWAAVDTAADKKADELLESFIAANIDIHIKRLECQQSPAAQMTLWLQSGEVPAPFTIDQDLELKASGESRATVRYVNHPLEGGEIRQHIAGGKTATRLGLTWKNRISFVLTDQLQIKRLAFLDILKNDTENQVEDAEEKFDIDFALMTGELAGMLADLTKALGGLKRGA